MEVAKVYLTSDQGTDGVEGGHPASVRGRHGKYCVVNGIRKGGYVASVDNLQQKMDLANAI